MSVRNRFVSDEARLPDVRLPHTPLQDTPLQDTPLRAAWRIARFLIIAAALYAGLALVAGTMLGGAVPPGAQLMVMSYVTLLALLGAHVVALRLDGGRSWAFVGLARRQAGGRRLALGFLLGALAIGVPSLLLLATGELRVQPSFAGSSWRAAGQAALLLLPAALVEELLLRGYLFAVLRETVGWRWTLIGTSIVFGLLHLQNPGASPESTMLVIVAGFFLGGVVLAARSLYAAWMAHFAWNWVMAGLMHTAVSGLGLPAPDYRVVSAGPAWLTGGAWGPEGGVAAGVSMLVCVSLLYARFLKPRGGRGVAGISAWRHVNSWTET